MSDRLPDLLISRAVTIPATEFRWYATRSSGPGGQNVNKVNSRVVLEWPVTVSPSISEPLRERFVAAFASRINQEGIFSVGCDEYRDQPRNLDACLERLREMLRSVLIPPKPRRPTKPSAGSHRRRLENKQQRSTTKQSRRRPAVDD